MEPYLYLIRTLIVVLGSIGEVEYRMHDNFVGIYREGILFAKIQAEKLFLLSKQGTLVKTNNEADMKDKLKQAYSIASIIK